MKTKDTSKVRGGKPGKALEILIRTVVDLKGAKVACRKLKRQIKWAQENGIRLVRLEKLLIKVRTKAKKEAA